MEILQNERMHRSICCLIGIAMKFEFTLHIQLLKRNVHMCVFFGKPRICFCVKFIIFASYKISTYVYF